MIKHHAAQWAEAARLYAAGLTGRTIANATGISETAVRRRAKLDGWRREEAAGASDGPAEETAASVEAVSADGAPEGGPKGIRPQLTKPTRAVRKALIRRLYNAIDLKLSHWEERMAAGRKLTAADSERMAKEVTAMISGFERVAETEGAIEKRDVQAATATDGSGERTGKRRGKSASRTQRSTTESDAERMRQEIAARLERLQIGGGETGCAD
jgi:hypothetical protein